MLLRILKYSLCASTNMHEFDTFIFIVCKEFKIPIYFVISKLCLLYLSSFVCSIRFVYCFLLHQNRIRSIVLCLSQRSSLHCNFVYGEPQLLDHFVSSIFLRWPHLISPRSLQDIKWSSSQFFSYSLIPSFIIVILPQPSEFLHFDLLLAFFLETIYW